MGELFDRVFGGTSGLKEMSLWCIWIRYYVVVI